MASEQSDVDIITGVAISIGSTYILEKIITSKFGLLEPSKSLISGSIPAAIGVMMKNKNPKMAYGAILGGVGWMAAGTLIGLAKKTEGLGRLVKTYWYVSIDGRVWGTPRILKPGVQRLGHKLIQIIAGPFDSKKAAEKGIGY